MTYKTFTIEQCAFSFLVRGRLGNVVVAGLASAAAARRFVDQLVAA
jgi:hypothetical protein